MKTLCILITFLFAWQINFSQEPLLTTKAEYAFNSDLLLDAIIDSAYRFSPEIRRIASSGELAEANAGIAKNNIYSALSLRSSYLYGTNYASVSNAEIDPTANFITNTQTGFYNIGLGLQLPLNLVMNRKYNLKAGISQIKMAEAEKQKAEVFVKQQVIDLYMSLKLSYKLLNYSNLNKKTAEINYALAEKEFLNGQLTLDQISRMQELQSKVLAEYETNLNRFQTSLLQLEAYTGVNFYNLLNSI